MENGIFSHSGCLKTLFGTKYCIIALSSFSGSLKGLSHDFNSPHRHHRPQSAIRQQRASGRVFHHRRKRANWRKHAHWRTRCDWRHTTIGEDNHIFQFASLGAQPQDKKYRDEPTQLIIGNRNTIREFTTFNTGTVTGIGQTRLGDDNWIMAYCHLAHDCVVGNHTIFANNASLAGHVEIGDYVVLGGYTLVFQFCRIGAYAMTAFATGVHKDVPPYFMASGYRAEPAGLNSEGMRRNGFTAEQIANVKKCL